MRCTSVAVVLASRSARRAAFTTDNIPRSGFRSVAPTLQQAPQISSPLHFGGTAVQGVSACRTSPLPATLPSMTRADRGPSAGPLATQNRYPANAAGRGASERRAQIVGHEPDDEHHAAYSREFTVPEKLNGSKTPKFTTAEPSLVAFSRPASHLFQAPMAALEISLTGLLGSWAASEA